MCKTNTLKNKHCWEKNVKTQIPGKAYCIYDLKFQRLYKMILHQTFEERANWF